MKLKRVSVAFICFIFVFSLYIASIPAQNEYTIRIVSVSTTDLQGNPKTSFRRGEIVVVNVNISSLITYYAAQPQTYLLIVEAFTPEEEVIALGFTSGQLASGQSVVTGYGFKIPADAPTGTYTIEVYVWNGWPAQMGAQWRALAEPRSVEITVTP